MKATTFWRITFSTIIALVILAAIALSAGKPKADSTMTVKKKEMLGYLQAQADEADDRFQKTLTKEQRGLLDRQKMLQAQMNAYQALADSTLTFRTNTGKR